MVSANKSVALEFSLAEQRALMRAAASEGAPPAAGSRQDNVHPVRGERERTCALEFTEIGDTKERFGLHDQTLTGRQRRTLPRRIFAVNPAVTEGLLREALSPKAIGRSISGRAAAGSRGGRPFHIISARSNNSARARSRSSADCPAHHDNRWRSRCTSSARKLCVVAARRRPESYAWLVQTMRMRPWPMGWPARR